MSAELSVAGRTFVREYDAALWREVANDKRYEMSRSASDMLEEIARLRAQEIRSERVAQQYDAQWERLSDALGLTEEGDPERIVDAALAALSAAKLGGEA